MVKRLCVILAIVFFLAAPAHATWTAGATWSRDFVNSGQFSWVAIPSTGMSGGGSTDYSGRVWCKSASGCTLTILGGGAVNFSLLMLGDRTADETNEANYLDTTTDLAAAGKVIDLVQGAYMLVVETAADAAGVAQLSGN